jgi:hypothetical protein
VSVWVSLCFCQKRNRKKEDTMKRIVTLVAAAALLLGLAATASAELAVKAAGSWRVHGNVLKNFNDFDDDATEQTFDVRHRMRTQFRFVYNENVMGELYTEYGNVTWGRDAGQYNATDGTTIDVKRAFIQFRWPDTDMLITAGEQDITLPSSGAFSNIVLGGSDGSAIAISSPITDMVGLTVAYARLDDSTAPAHSTFDAYVAALPVSLDGMKLSPWFTYAQLGSQSDFAVDDQAEDGNFWWVGLGFNMDMLDPIMLYADFTYGSASDEVGDNSGWLIDVMGEFKGLDFAVLQLMAAYSSQNDDGDGAMPVVDSDFGVGGSLINGSSFSPGDLGPATPGFWLVGAAARNVTFVEKLSHDVIFLYAKGTNDENPGFGSGDAGSLPELTSDDSWLEVDFNTRYQIYESLAAVVELAYGKPSFDDDDVADDALMKASFGFLYKF